MLVPLFLLPFYPEEKGFWVYYAAPAVLSLVSGIVLCFGTMRTPDTLSDRRILTLHGSTPVLFAWIYLSLLGAVPFWASGELTFTRALFESVSGWTTTGLTVMIPPSEEQQRILSRLAEFNQSVSLIVANTCN